MERSHSLSFQLASRPLRGVALLGRPNTARKEEYTHIKSGGGRGERFINNAIYGDRSEKKVELGECDSLSYRGRAATLIPLRSSRHRRDGRC